MVERLPEIIEAFRTALARLRSEYAGHLHIYLQVPPPKPSAAQIELNRQFRARDDRAEYERHAEEEREALERQYLYQLKKQEGGPIDPEEFAAPEQVPLPPIEEEEDEDDEDDGGDIAYKKKPEPTFNWFNEHDHPLAEAYALLADLSLSEFWIHPHHRSIAVHLLQREPDVEIPEDPRPA